jgi:hypothetical protein
MTPTELRTRIVTDEVPLVTRWDLADGPAYVLEFEDADVSVRLTEAQVRGLGARILAATLDDLSEYED